MPILRKTMGPTLGILTNPNSGKNRRNPGRKAELQRAVGRHGVVLQTRDLDELEAAVEELIDAGCEYWVCDGGDGTLHWLLSVGHRIARERGNGSGPVPLPKIVPANGGSIDFVAHRAGIRGQAVDVIRSLVDALKRGEPLPTVSLDTFRMTGTLDESGELFDRVGFASAIGGVAQNFFEKLYERKPVDAWRIVQVLGKGTAGAFAGSVPRPLGDFVLPRLRSFADELFEPAQARVDVDGVPLAFDSFSSLQVGSIDISLGGVVRTFRHAKAQGVLHAQAISASRVGIVANLPNIVMGTPIWGDKVFDGPAKTIRARATNGKTLDPVIDGELFFGLRELEVTGGPRLEVPRVCVH